MGEEEGRPGQPHAPSPSSPNWTRRGRRPPSFLLLLSPFLPFSYSNKERWSPTPGGSRSPPLVHPPPWPATSPLLLYIRGQGAPLDTQVDLLIYPSHVRCPPPSTIFHLGNIVGVLRRSPASVASSTPSSRRRADRTLPQSSAGSEFEGRHRAERVLISEVPCIRYLIGQIVKTYDYINRVMLTLPLSVYEGTWTKLFPLVAMHHHDLACA